MPKYYVRSGGFQCVVDQPDQDEGLIRGLSKIIEAHPDDALGLLTQISERGFDDDGMNDDTQFISTAEVLRQLGLADLYELGNEEKNV